MEYVNEGLEIRHPKGSIAHKIASARYLQKNFGETLLQDKMLQNLLLQLDQNIEATWKEMAAVGVMRECTDCAINNGGSCCGAGMEEWYDEVLLLINLLLGKTLPERAQDNSSCYFLTDQGCILRARQVICVNYLCQRIYRNIRHEKLIRLQVTAGRELNSLFILEEYVKKKLRGINS